MKENILGIIFAIICIFFFYSINKSMDYLFKLQAEQKDIMLSDRATIKAVAKQLAIKEQAQLESLKLEKNLEVFGDISCGKCHNSSELALPLRNIELNEAIKIVRFGNERSIAGGMPQYKSINNGKDAWISDSGLKGRLEALYTKEFLSTALDRNYRIIGVQ
ncbi:hypothetical protein CQA49_09225 [Helicobacter sp. MIT 00-7814]|uniref:hypothetical protein n=1 Tax=unclassified Helicobacter TaxID=2593540 RepID=UPI000E1EE251|nr:MULTISPECIES: hypothetical protein [unclassified Helicobacter]RDU51765.1 hypothetical protein CQA49_09225 [Helicobacter sp. MIT 00-7814]RDU51776.1 hypothetical protein CQA37_09370 [Helicobacter sp. MIT 99-10781]